jgi:pre-mRNA-splicing factor ATP-dependent RNA helicase DHX38/PRP16
MNEEHRRNSNGSNADSSTRLTSLLPSNIKGGLISKAQNESQNSMPPPPQRSKLGLDRSHRSSRNYRSRADETPSHAGGVNLEAERRVRERDRERRSNLGSHSGDYRHGSRSSRSRRGDEDDGDYHNGERDRRHEHGDRRESSSRKRHRNHSRSRSHSPDRVRDKDRNDERYSARDRERGRDKNHHSEMRHRSSSSRRDTGRDYDRDQDRNRDRNRDIDHDQRSRGRDSERRRNRDRERDNVPNVTPSTQASYSSSRQYSERRRREDVAYAETPMRYSNTNSQLRRRENPTPRGRNSSLWENETPMAARGQDQDEIARRSASTSVRQFPGDGAGETPTPMIRSNNGNNSSADTNLARNDDDFDRQFYLADDEEFVQDGDKNMGRFLYESAKTKQREEEMKRQRDQNSAGIVNPANSLRNLKRNALKDDQEAWENSRLLSSGAAVRGEVDLEFKSEDDTRVTLLVHQVKPPFLGKGASAFSRIRHAVPTVKDNTSDFAKMARAGSVTLRSLREKKEKNTMRNKFWQIGGTRMGRAVGVKEEEKDESTENKNGVVASNQSTAVEENAQGEVDYKKSSGFASHMNKDGEKSEAVSEFARKKTIREQRQFLPAFTVRDDLLNVIRENNVIVVVGETGSG